MRAAPASAWRELLREPYDAYYRSRHYDERYPAPNPGTLDFLWRHGVTQARRIADVGCGNGRYAFPVLEQSRATLVGCDISTAALDAFRSRLQGLAIASRVSLEVGGPEALPRTPAFDCMLMLFGVLSHIGPRTARVEALRQLRARAGAGTWLLLSVPSVWRRLPLDLLRSRFGGDRRPWGEVAYVRVIAGRTQSFRYHLYGLRGLRSELAEAGWAMARAEAESVFPERLVTRSRLWARLDRWLQPWWPAALGYGIRVAARPARQEVSS